MFGTRETAAPSSLGNDVFWGRDTYPRILNNGYNRQANEQEPQSSKSREYNDKTILHCLSVLFSLSCFFVLCIRTQLRWPSRYDGRQGRGQATTGLRQPILRQPKRCPLLNSHPSPLSLCPSNTSPTFTSLARRCRLSARTLLSKRTQSAPPRLRYPRRQNLNEIGAYFSIFFSRPLAAVKNCIERPNFSYMK